MKKLILVSIVSLVIGGSIGYMSHKSYPPTLDIQKAIDSGGVSLDK